MSEPTPQRIMELGLGFWGSKAFLTNVTGLLMSLNMLIETPAGFDYTGADCQRWLHEAGFQRSYVSQLLGPNAMVVGIK